MRFTQLAASQGVVWALGEDGCVYRQFSRDVIVPEEFEYDEFGGHGPAKRREFYWGKQDRFEQEAK